MKLTEKQYKQEIEKMQNKGLKINGSCMSNYHLSNKHSSRYILIIEWLKSRNLSTSCEFVEQLYKADVVIRRQLSEILKPIEIQFGSWIKYYFTFNNIGVKELLNKEPYEKSADFSIYTHKKGSLKFVQDKLKGKESIPINDIIDRMMFGTLVGLICLLDKKHIDIIFSDNEFSMTKEEFTNILNEMVYLRNYIAHNEILFSNKKLFINERTISLKSIIISLDKITLGSYSQKLEKYILKYQKYSYEDLSKKTPIDKLEFDKIFKNIISYLLG
ncbi:Abi family protein [Mycoplasma todarodis]|uniref:Abi family protein n=1 Tax=Mycoplasma todarodis TaxID=1937191 RepID=UPI003B2B71CF